MLKSIPAVLLIGTAALCISLTACSNSGSGGDVAAVNGQKISRADFDKKLEASPGGKQTLNQLVQQSLVDQYGRDNHVDVSSAEIQKKEDELKAQYPNGQFDTILKTQGFTETDLQNLMREQIIIEKAVAPQVKVSDADIKAYFDKNHTLLDKPEQVRARHILLSDQATANQVEAKLKAGGNFADLAKQYSKDPSNKDKGGELGFFARGAMVKEFSDAAYSMKVGETSKPIHTAFGWHIINVEEKKPAVHATLASTRSQIHDVLAKQQQGQQVPVFLQQIRSKANIVVYDDRYKDLFPQTAGAPPGAAAPSAAAPAAAAPSPAAKK